MLLDLGIVLFVLLYQGLSGKLPGVSHMAPLRVFPESFLRLCPAGSEVKQPPWL